jgi:peroxiredoxin Q/BCP
VKLIGASFDTSRDNKAFASKHDYRGTLLSDVDRTVGERYETRKAAGEPYPEMAKRRTYVIDPDGVIRRAIRVTDIPGHPQQVLDDLRELLGT